jgi:hypothetical protein
LGADFLVDIDGKEIGIENAYNHMIDVWHFLKKRYQELTFVMTGSGFHVWVWDFEKKFKKYPENPYGKEEYNKQQRKRLVRQMLDKNLVFDVKISLDTRRVGRVPRSIYAGRKIIMQSHTPTAFPDLLPEGLKLSEALARLSIPVRVGNSGGTTLCQADDDAHANSVKGEKAGSSLLCVQEHANASPTRIKSGYLHSGRRSTLNQLSSLKRLPFHPYSPYSPNLPKRNIGFLHS